MTFLATGLCVVLIIWLLILDSRRRVKLSATTWIPTLLFFTLASRTPANWLGEYAYKSPIDQVYFAVLIGSAVLILSMRIDSWGKILGANAPLLLFYGYFAVSSIWSSSPGDSAIRLVKDFGLNVPIALLILSERNPMEVIRAVYVRCACVTFPLSLLFTRYFTLGKSYSRSGLLSYSGVATQKNALGEMLMVCILFLAWDHLESRHGRAKWTWRGMRWDRLALLLMGGWLLYLSQSKTALVCTVIGIALIFGKAGLTSRWMSATMFWIALALPLVVLFTQMFGSVAAPVLDALGRDATFTGRTSVWREITLSTVNPLIGTGFYVFWGGAGEEAISDAVGVGIINAHNGYLDIYLDGGLIGLAVLFVLLVASAKRIIPNLSLNSFGRVRFAFLIIAMIGNLTESIFGRISPLWFTSVLVFINYSSLTRKWRPSDVGVGGSGQPGVRVSEALL